MEKKDFMKVWKSLPPDEETKNYKPAEGDIYFALGGYLFICQKDGNIIFKKHRDTKFTLRNIFKSAKLYLIAHKVFYIRVEGSLRRYNFLKKMMPELSIYRDPEITDRNVFYIQLYKNEND